MKPLDFNHKYSTKYCIPLWVRDEQVKQAIRRNAKRIQPQEKHDGKIAIVAYGPSLKETWEQLKDFDGPIMSCSGAHQFLIEKGIIPKWHVAVDPLPGNTVKLIGKPHPDVEYLISSTCHSDVFDLLKDSNVTLWHVFATDEEASRILPKGEWAITGGSDVGMRCLTIARFFGYTDLHIFGIDGSWVEGKNRHAGEHPVPQKGAPLEYEGKTFLTTPAMLESAKMVFHELEQLHDVDAAFYGEGLVQHMSKFWKKKEVKDSLIAFNNPELISANYMELNRKLHETNLYYGVGGGKHAPMVAEMKEAMKAQSVLDYGCGKGYLQRELKFPIWEYDPAIPGKETPPRPADLVICTDVLEHIEPDKLLYVLSDLKRVTKQVGYFLIHTGASSKFLEDGRNAHLIQQDTRWWVKHLKKFFTVVKIWEQKPLLHVVVGPLVKAKPVPAPEAKLEVVEL